jgi:transposase
LQLANLFVLRERLLKVQKALIVPIKEQVSFVNEHINLQSQRNCERSLEAISIDIKNVEVELDKIIADDQRLSHLFKLISSVNCVGRLTAIQIIISTNEFLDITNPKKFACYAGVAPFTKESGLKPGKAKVSHIANKKVKALIHFCALIAICRDKELKEYYQRKTKAEGKPKMLVINAVRNKLILRVFACLKQNRMFEKEYTRFKHGNQILIN